MDDGAGGSDLAVRWCALAEQRLVYLTGLFESDRWRRYYSELSFLQNIQEAKTAVETWRSLSARGAAASAGSGNVRISALPVAPEPMLEAAAAMEGETAPSEEVPSKADADALIPERTHEDIEEPALDLAAIEKRYPLLRNTL
jgi:hypothetical protein